MGLRKEIKEFIEVIKENNHEIEIEVYNFTLMTGDIFTDIDQFDLYMTKNIHHEISLDNLVVNDHVIDCNLSYEDLTLLLSNNAPHLVNEIMKYNGISVERAIEILEDSFIIDARNEVDAFREWFEIYRSDTYNQLTSMQLVTGVQGAECYVDWEKVCRDYQLSSIIEIFNVEDTYIIY